MKYESLLALARDLPVVESQLLRATGGSPSCLAVQLSRWVSTGKLIQLRRGMYVLPDAFRPQHVTRERMANLVHTPSYVSLERALECHGMIPERVEVIQSVTTHKPLTLDTDLGRFAYRHVKRDWFFGYQEQENGALMAVPEKALLDLFYLTPGEWTLERIEQLRLQQLEIFDLEKMRSWVRSHRLPRLQRAVNHLSTLLAHDEWEVL